MNSSEFSSILNELNLTKDEVAKYFEVTDRTVRRWIQNDCVPDIVSHAITAWRKLNKIGVAWRPNSVDIIPVDDFIKKWIAKNDLLC